MEGIQQYCGDRWSSRCYDQIKAGMKYKAKIDWCIGASFAVGLALPVVIANSTGGWMYGVAVVT
jgi:hypothetical protein